MKPLLAATLTDLRKLTFPLIASPKLDGIRCIMQNGVPMSRKLKPIPNKHVQKMLAWCGKNLDGELMVDGLDYNGVQSAIMSEHGEPNFTYYVFDYMRPLSVPLGYAERLADLQAMDFPAPVKVLEAKAITTLEELLVYEQECVSLGYEGIMLRSLSGQYKFGRSTEREGILLKMKRFQDAEAQVIGFEERMHNGNEAQKDELGRTKRSAAKAGMVGRGDLGALICQDMNTLVVFSIGSGFNDAQRKDIWDKQEEYYGKTVTYKYQELSAYNVPRFPVFKGWRRD